MSDSGVADIAATPEVEDEGRRSARPFIKWAGGKAQLLDQLQKRLPGTFKRYWEPFLGGGAFFFSLAPNSAVLSDINEELVLTYIAVRDNVEELISELRQHRYEEQYFYSVRDWDKRPDFKDMSAVERAGRFIFLNKTGFNGLYRVNSKGQFNVPFGRYSNPTIVDTDNLRRCSECLRNVDIRLSSYLAIENEVQEGDLVYFDPPYVPLSTTSSFTSYTKDGFGFDDQIALRDLIQRLANKGAFILLSNSASPFVEALYEGFTIERVSATRAINSKAERRGAVDELIISSKYKKRSFA
ncbi:MAG: DNA adenine methylase [Pseudomonadota bacterium]|jgi:DNA adenine methylase